MTNHHPNARFHFIPQGVIFIFATALLVALCAVKGSAQDRRPQQQQYQPPVQQTGDPMMPNVIVAPGEDYRIGPSDVIEIMVGDMPELSRRFRVSSEGQIQLPILGRLVVQDLTTLQLAKRIEDKLRGDYLTDPQVSIDVLQINSRTFFIQGAVRRPGLYQVEGQPSLLKLITIAGGLIENYGSTAYIMREINAGTGDRANQGADQPVNQSAGETQPGESASAANSNPPATAPHAARYELVKVNINGLLRGNFDQNITIGPGDIIHIPPTDVFFVAGEVNAPGSFPLKEGTTLRQAISLAQGATFQGASNRSIIFREDLTTGKRQEIAVDIPAIMNGKLQDMPILANDIIIIPNSRLKSVTSTLLKAFGVNSTRIPYR